MSPITERNENSLFQNMRKEVCNATIGAEVFAWSFVSIDIMCQAIWKGRYCMPDLKPAAYVFISSTAAGVVTGVVIGVAKTIFPYLPYLEG